MSERRAVTLALAAAVTVASAACAAVLALGGSGELVAVTMFLVGGLGVDQVSKLIMSFDRPRRR
ncbi:MAG TPA: hypothetical protein VNM41_00545 [Solirubrobacterales bacterium]|nr:hypothetical protein [Solirubrobacterales bacterium]